MKRATMAQALSAAAGHAFSRPVAGTDPAEHVEVSISTKQRSIHAVPPSRAGKKPVTGFFSPETSRQLKKMAFDQEKTMQELVQEALNDLFRKYDLPPIA